VQQQSGDTRGHCHAINVAASESNNTEASRFQVADVVIAMGPVSTALSDHQSHVSCYELLPDR
jgi:hypothetical protein